MATEREKQQAAAIGDTTVGEPQGEETRRDWEVVQENVSDVTERLKVVGGSLYRVMNKNTGTVAVAFAPGA